MKTVEELEKEIKEIENKVNVTTKEYQDTMNNHIENMEKILEELKNSKNAFEPTPKDWMPKDGEIYYFADATLNTDFYHFTNDKNDKGIVKYNRIFKTEEECQLFCDIQRAFRNASREFKHEKNNYYLHCCMTEKELSTQIDSYCKRADLYFDSQKTIQSLINKFGEENVKRYYLGVY